MKNWLIEILGCPYDHVRLDLATFEDERDKTEIVNGVLTCPMCERWFAIVDGIPEMILDQKRVEFTNM